MAQASIGECERLGHQMYIYVAEGEPRHPIDNPLRIAGNATKRTLDLVGEKGKAKRKEVEQERGSSSGTDSENVKMEGGGKWNFSSISLPRKFKYIDTIQKRKRSKSKEVSSGWKKLTDKLCLV